MYPVFCVREEYFDIHENTIFESLQLSSDASFEPNLKVSYLFSFLLKMFCFDTMVFFMDHDLFLSLKQ